MFCPNCGFEDTGTFCSKCGSLLDISATEPVKKKKSRLVPLLVSILMIIGIAYVFLRISGYLTPEKSEGFSGTNREVSASYQSIDETVFSSAGVTLKCIGIEASEHDFILTFEASNTTKKDLMIEIDSARVNSYKFLVYDWIDIDAGKSLYYQLSSDDFSYYDYVEFPTVDSISLNFTVYDKDFNKLRDEQVREIAFFADHDYEVFEGENTFFRQEVLFENENLVIRKLFIGKNYYSGLKILVVYENLTDRTVTIKLTDYIINGSIVDDYSYENLDANEKRIDEIYLSDNNQYDPDDFRISFSFVCYDSNGTVLAEGTTTEYSTKD